jgi:hypothetical protein
LERFVTQSTPSCRASYWRASSCGLPSTRVTLLPAAMLQPGAPSAAGSTDRDMDALTAGATPASRADVVIATAAQQAEVEFTIPTACDPALHTVAFRFLIMAMCDVKQPATLAGAERAGSGVSRGRRREGSRARRDAAACRGGRRGESRVLPPSVALCETLET